MKAVLDASAFIYLNDFRMFDDVFTVYDVIREVKDKINSIKMSGVNVSVIDPGKHAVQSVRQAAKETGDLSKLSETDVEILALAKEKNLSVVSDDYSVQNVAEKLGLTYISLFNKKITKAIRWSLYCEKCKKVYDNATVCAKCGGSLVRKRLSEEFIRQENNQF